MQVITQGEHRASDRSLQRGTARLAAALLAGTSPEQRLALPLLLLLAQQRKLITLQTQSPHLKLIAELYDKCHETCIQCAGRGGAGRDGPPPTRTPPPHPRPTSRQAAATRPLCRRMRRLRISKMSTPGRYAEFLQHALGPEEYARLLPPMTELARVRRRRQRGQGGCWAWWEWPCPTPPHRGPTPPHRDPTPAPPRPHPRPPQDYQIDPELVFELHRPIIRTLVPPPPPPAAEAEAEAEADQQQEDGEIREGGAGDAAAKAAGEAMDEDGELPAAATAADAQPPADAAAAAAAARWAALEWEVAGVAAPGGGDAPFRGLSPGLYTTFWCLGLYDLEVPAGR